MCIFSTRILLLLFLFFFSSRRRHTRFKCDWSSDVCSSDLAAEALALRGLPFEIMPGTIVAGYSPIRSEIDPTSLMQKLAAQGARLALPAITAGDQPLKFRAWSPGDGLQRGRLGILEPSPDAP